MGRLDEFFGQSHVQLVNTAIEIAKAMGYTKITKEYRIEVPEQFRIPYTNAHYIVDVYGEKENGENIAFECGDLSTSDEIDKVRRLTILSLLVDKFIWMPYFTTKISVIPDTLQSIVDIMNMKEQKARLKSDINDLKLEHDDLKGRIDLFMKEIRNVSSIVDLNKPLRNLVDA